MGAVLELDPLDFGNLFKEWQDRNLLYLVQRSRNEESWGHDFVDDVDNSPVLQRSDDVEFRRSNPIKAFNSVTDVLVKSVIYIA